MRAPALLALALLGPALAGCSGGAPPAEPEWVEVTIPGRQMLDLEYTLSSGTPLAWLWESEGTLAFQALYVEGASAYPLASEYGSRGSGERTAPQSGRYDLTWDNQGPGNVTLRFIVADGYTQRTWPPGQGPGCAPLALLFC